MPRKPDPLLNVVCPQCGKAFRTTRQRRQNSIQTGLNFCSMTCAARYRAEHGIALPPRRKPKQGNTVVKPCSYCGKPITRQRYEIESRSKFGPFCNHICYGQWRIENLAGENSPSWKGGYELWYDGNWKSQRAKARKRDNHTCQECGRTAQSWGYALDVHHIVDYDCFDNPKQANRLENLVTLCRNCHAKRHADLQRLLFP